jgi:hypothetical protein
MPGTRKLQYNSYYVRPEFRRTVCRELDLPSGRPSGYELYPVDGAFVQEIASIYEAPSKSVMSSCGAENVHEWLLWTAARLKYGTNYLNPKRNQFWLEDDMYEPIKKQQNEFEEELIKLENIVEQRMEWLSETLTECGKQEKTKKMKNILRECLTSEEVDV